MRPRGSDLGPAAPELAAGGRRQRILALADAGVTAFVANEFAHGLDRERTRSLLKAVIAGS